MTQHFANTAFSIENISLGPCLVFWKGATDIAYRHVGHTYGGVDISITQSAYDLKSDQYGDTPVKSVDAGIKMEVTVNMTEATFDNLKMMFTTATSHGTGVYEYLTFGKPVGGALNTGELILEPTDGSSKVRIYRAAANVGGAMTIAYAADKQRVFACKFNGMIDNTRAEGDQLFRMGGVYALIANETTPITPTHGALSGGTSVTITLDDDWCPDLTTYALSALAVTFGAVAATVVSVTKNTITLTTPAHAAGAVDVIITLTDTDDTYTATLEDLYSYDAS